MKRISFLLIVVFGMVYTGLAQMPDSPHATAQNPPRPTKPAAALKAKMTGSGTCKVVFNSTGHVESAVMTKSLGSKILDENTVSFARKNWTGRPNSTVLVPITYEPSAPKYQNLDSHVYAPTPPYPYQARQKKEHGRGIVQVKFDEQGRPVSAIMTKSTGSAILDGNTVNFVLKMWKYPPGKKRTILAPVDYELR